MTRPMQFRSVPLKVVLIALTLFAPLSVSASSAKHAGSEAASIASDTVYDLLVGFFAFKNEQYSAAAQHFLSAAQVHPNAAIAEYAMRAALLADDEDKAIAAGQLWSRVDEGNPVSVEFRIRAYSRLAAIEPAIDELERLRQLSAGDGYHGFLPLLPLLFRDPSNLISVKLMQGLVERHQHDVYAHFAMADLAMRFRLPQLVMSASQRALHIQPNFSPAAMQYASALQSLRQKDKALDYLDQYLQEYPRDEQVRAYYARLLGELDLRAESYAQYLILSEHNRANEDYVYALAHMAFEFEDYDTAWRYFLELVVRGERSEEAKFMLGKIDESIGNIATAISWYSAVGPSQFFFDGQVRAVQLLVKSGNYDAARAAIHALRESNPVGRLTELILLEGSALVAAGRAEEAYRLYTEYLDGPPKRHAELLYARAVLSRDGGDRVAYRKDLQEVLVFDDEHYASLRDLALELIADRQFEQASRYMQRALDLRPDDPQTLASYGWLQLSLGQYSMALSYLERAAELADDPSILAHLGEALWQSGRVERARLVWHRGLAKAPDDKRLNALIREH